MSDLASSGNNGISSFLHLETTEVYVPSAKTGFCLDRCLAFFVDKYIVRSK